MPRVFLSLALLAILGSYLLAETRPPAAAGSFYPAQTEELAYQVGRLLKVVQPTIEGDVVAMIIPHAGYTFSGRVAASAYGTLAGRRFNRVVLIGTSHKMAFDYIAAPDSDFFQTPLGDVPVDKDFIQKMLKISDRIMIDNKPHKTEHSLEVQLPFLQAELKGFKVVPLLFGNPSYLNSQTLAYALSLLVDDRTLIIASSDLSHYYPYQVAQKLDGRGIDLILKEDLAGYTRGLIEGETEACGAPAIVTVMLLAPALGANKIELLAYANSGDTAGEKSKVVGYAAVAYSRRETVLSEPEQKELLSIARKTIKATLYNWKIPDFYPAAAGLKENRGAFVTLTNQGRLRGCIGYILPLKPLYQTVQQTAIEAATNDSRFDRLTKKELKETDIEISALSKLKKVADISEIEIGRDGLYILNGRSSGLLLPQVATELGWDRDEFLRQVSLKAGLPENAWQDSNSTIYRFTAQVFRE